MCLIDYDMHPLPPPPKKKRFGAVTLILFVTLSVSGSL